MENYEGDVLEHALNFGIVSSAKRFNLTEEEVYKIVKAFKQDIKNDICECEEAAKRGKVMMCFMCSRMFGSHRIKI